MWKFLKKCFYISCIVWSVIIMLFLIIAGLSMGHFMIITLLELIKFEFIKEIKIIGTILLIAVVFLSSPYILNWSWGKLKK